MSSSVVDQFLFAVTILVRDLELIKVPLTDLSDKGVLLIHYYSLLFIIKHLPSFYFSLLIVTSWSTPF